MTKTDKTEPTGRLSVLQSASRKLLRALAGILPASYAKPLPFPLPSFVFSLYVFPQSVLKILFGLNTNIICDFSSFWDITFAPF